MKHLNSNVICAIDIETTGKMPGFHELIELSIVPLQGFKPDKSILPLTLFIQPLKPYKTRSVLLRDRMTNAIETTSAAFIFEKWYEKLNLKAHKRILPLSFAWHRKMPFIMEWLTHDKGDPYYYDFFDPLIVRDLVVLLQYWNDIAFKISEHYPFTKQRLAFLAQKLGVPVVRPSTTLSRCLMMIEIYRKFTELKINIIDLPFNYPTPIDYSLPGLHPSNLPSEEDELDNL